MMERTRTAMLYANRQQGRCWWTISKDMAIWCKRNHRRLCCLGTVTCAVYDSKAVPGWFRASAKTIGWFVVFEKNVAVRLGTETFQLRKWSTTAKIVLVSGDEKNIYLPASQTMCVFVLSLWTESTACERSKPKTILCFLSTCTDHTLGG